MTNVYRERKVIQCVRHQHSEQNCYWQNGEGGMCVFLWEGYFSVIIKISYVSVMKWHIYLLMQIHCITAGFTLMLHDLLNTIHDTKTELKLKNIC